MANDTLIFEVKTTAKGLKVVQKDTDALADSVERTNTARDKAGKSQNKYHKREKALTQGTLSSGRAFSKLNQTIGGGSSGLVGAYATLMANVFALTAAFGELRRASALEQLVKGLEATGAAAGSNLEFASKKLQEVSGFAISAEQALKGMALGASAGFSTTQMEGLTRVARGASIALGRDMGDAMDRLTRGTAKLEPEILDELGIMVRLDDATEKYAATLGKNADDLTQYERRQAFLNATLEQGTKKFKDVIEAADTNPYDRLAASMGNLVKEGLTLVNQVLGPLASMLAQSTGALIGAVILFGSTISRQLLPGLSDMAAGTAAAARAQGDMAVNSLKNLKVAKNLPNAYNEAVESMADGEINQQKFNKALYSTNSSITRYTGNLKKMTVSNWEEAKSYTGKWVKMQQVKMARSDLIRTMLLHQGAQAKQGVADAVEITQQRGLIAGFVSLGATLKKYTADTLTATAATGGLTRAWGLAKVAALGFAGSMRVVGTAILGALGWIGLLVTAGMMIYDALKDMIPVNHIEEGLKDIQEELSITKDIADKFNKESAAGGVDSARAQEAGYKSLTGQFAMYIGQVEMMAGKAMAQRDQDLKDLKQKLQEEKLAFKKHYDDLDRIKFKEHRDKGVGGGSGLNDSVDKGTARRGMEDAQKAWKEHQTQINIVTNTAEKQKLAAVKKGLELQVKSLKNTRGDYQNFVNPTILMMEDLAKSIGTPTGPKNVEAVTDALEKQRAAVGNISSAWEGANDIRNEAQKASAALANKDKTPFDAQIQAYENIQGSLDTLEQGYKDLNDGTTIAARHTKAYANSLEALKERLGIAENTARAGFKTWKEYVKAMNDSRVASLEAKKETLRLGKVVKRVSDLSKTAGGAAAMEEQLRVQNELINQKQNEYKITIGQHLQSAGHAQAAAYHKGDEIKKQEIINDLIKNNSQFAKDYSKELKGHNDLSADLISTNERNAKIEEARLMAAAKLSKEREKALNIEKDIMKANQTIAKNNMILDKIAKDKSRIRETGANLTAIEELELFFKYRNEREKMIKDEADMKLAALDLEYALLDVRMAVIKAEIAAAVRKGDIAPEAGNAILAQINALPNLQKKTRALQEKQISRQKAADLGSLKVEELKAKIAADKHLQEIMASDMSAGAKAAAMGEGYAQMIAAGEAAIRANAEKVAAEMITEKGYDPATAQAYISKKGDTAVAGATDTDKMGAASAINDDAMSQSRTRLESMRGTFSSMAETLKSLGPEGEAMAVMQEGAFSLMDTWMEVGEKIKGGSFEMADGIKAVGATIAAIGQMMQARTKMQVAGVDKEIAAEKKKDGKSKESLAKIAALEKKKDNLKRKAFNQNKKMAMGQAVIATAVAAMEAAKGPPPLPYSAPFVAMAIAMGAAQLAAIASTSYQGGSSGVAGAPAKPSSVSVGKRNSKVDLSKMGNIAGELAYLRGERGTGSGASNFRPTGRFSGGDATAGVGYIVGEQGPELFMPNVPGRIAGNSYSAGGVQGTPVAVTFTINTLDSSTLEETLTTQRGNIISMIREAANSSGEQFLESVDTLGLQTEWN